MQKKYSPSWSSEIVYKATPVNSWWEETGKSSGHLETRKSYKEITWFQQKPLPSLAWGSLVNQRREKNTRLLISLFRLNIPGKKNSCFGIFTARPTL